MRQNETKNSGTWIKNAALQPYLYPVQTLSVPIPSGVPADIPVTDQSAQGSTYSQADLSCDVRLHLWIQEDNALPWQHLQRSEPALGTMAIVRSSPGQQAIRV